MVAFRTVFAALAAPLLFASGTAAQVLTAPKQPRALEARQIAVADLCVPLDISLAGFNLLSDTCICVNAGVITPATVARIRTQLQAGGGALATIINTLGGLTSVVTQIVSNVLPGLLQGQTTTCVYPDNSTPTTCGDCGYECDAGFNQCGDGCLSTAQTCPSNQPQRRHLTAGDVNNLCPLGFEPCMLPTATRFTGGNYECIRTSSDLESCGGCAYPLPGRKSGVDCSAIPNVGSASCSSGQCQIETCLRGFVSNGTECIPSNGRVMASYWAALEEAARITVQK